MKLTPNLSNRLRVLYVFVGLVMIAGAFAVGLEGWWRLIVPVFGGMLLVTGATGW